MSLFGLNVSCCHIKFKPRNYGSYGAEDLCISESPLISSHMQDGKSIKADEYFSEGSWTRPYYN